MYHSWLLCNVFHLHYALNDTVFGKPSYSSSDRTWCSKERVFSKVVFRLQTFDCSDDPKMVESGMKLTRVLTGMDAVQSYLLTTSEVRKGTQINIHLSKAS